MTTANINEASTATVPLTQTQHKSFEPRRLTEVLLGPLAGVLVWLLPLGLDPAMQTAFAIALFMIVYWIQEPIDHAITALIGCYLFYALGVAKFSVAFSGFASSTPWFMFGALLIGEAASRTGLAKRLGYLVLLKVGTSYSRLLLGVITLSFLLNFLIPSGPARVTVIAPILLGVIAVFGLSTQSNVGKGLFLILTYTCGLFDKMIMSGASAILTRGIIEEQTGIEVLWSQWFLAYLPAIVITIFACWLVMQWFYPAEKALPDGKQYFQNSLEELGPWRLEEKKVLAWIAVTVALWTTDFIHHINPAVIGIGTGLFLTLPRIGVLDTKAVKQVNFLVIIFCAGALSMGSVLTQTRVLHAVTDGLVTYIAPLLSSAFQSAIALYSGGILYHLLLANNQSMLSTSLPLLLQVTDGMGLNPVALGLIWVFAGGGNLFVYQSSVLVLGYSYGYFDGKDLLKVGAVLTFLEGLLLMVLVPFYWPLIGLNWLN